MTGEQLKKSILQHAIEGKLVRQDPADEPAEALLARIRAEKRKLLKEGKIKKYTESRIYKGEDGKWRERVAGKKQDAEIDVPFELPAGWAWARFSEIVSFKLGKTPERHIDKFWNEGVYPWFSIADLKEHDIVFSTKEKVSEAALKEKFAGSLVPKGTLLMSFKLTIGKTSILGIDALHNEGIISVFPYVADGNITRDFLFYALPALVNYVKKTNAMKGATLRKQ